MGAPAKRIESLDQLRGMLALSVMVYHFASWSSGESVDAGSVLGRLGVYAVSTFYVLSGLSLGIVYLDRIRTGADVAAFGIRRAFRIAPLFWIAVTASVLLGKHATPYTLSINYLLAFGFIAPGDYLTTGAWSIGNECVFYALFALLLLRGRWLPLALALSVIVGIVFAFVLLTPAVPLRSQWAIYIHPANQAFLFLAGVMLTRAKVGGWWLVALGAAVFVLWPADGDKAAIVTGWSRIVLSAACIAVVCGVYHWQPTVPGAISFLGRGSYSIYLLHPLVAQIIAPAFGYVAAAAATLAVSWASYRYVELPCMEAGAAIARRVRGRSIRPVELQKHKPD